MGALPPEASNERSDLAILVIGEDGCYIASCPQFKGCHSYGETVGEALENIGEFALMCLEVAQRRAQRNPQWIRITEKWYLISDHFAAAPDFLRRPDI